MKILADIGGTYARFAKSDGQDIESEKKYPVTDFDNFETAVELYAKEYGLEQVPLAIATAAYPDQAGLWCFVNKNPWVIDPESLNEKGWAVDLILNDFEAAVWGLKNLKDDDQKILKPGVPDESLPKCLIGPGTGLGLGYLCGHRVQKTHGGHMPVAGMTDEHWQVIKAVQEVKGHDTVPVFENFVSGPGLYNIYLALCAINDQPAKVENVEVMLGQNDQPKVQDALRLFHEFFGLFAQTVTVSGHAYGGLYLTGGVLERLDEKGLFDFARFEKFFVLDCVASVKQALQNTPVIQIKHPYLALQGLINYA